MNIQASIISSLKPLSVKPFGEQLEPCQTSLLKAIKVFVEFQNIDFSICIKDMYAANEPLHRLQMTGLGLKDVPWRLLCQLQRNVWILWKKHD